MKGLWAVRGYAQRYWKGILLLLLLMLAAAALKTQVIVRTLPVFEGLFSSLEGADALQRATHLDAIITSAAWLLGAVLLATVAEAGVVFMGDWLGQSVLYALRCDVFEHLQRLSMRFFEGRRSGELVSRVNNDTTVLQSTLGASLTGVVQSPLTALALTAYMGWLSWRLMLVMVIIVPTVGLLTKLMGQRIRGHSRRVQEELASMTANVEETFFLSRVIKMFGLEGIMIRRFRGDARQVYRAELRVTRMRVANALSVGVLLGVVWCGVLVFGAFEILAQRMTGAALMAFVLAMQTVAMEVNRLARALMTIQRGEAAALRTLELMQEVPAVQDRPGAVALERMQGEVRFEQVWFAYDGERHVLQGLDLEVCPGETVALVGPSGAGKSTIAGLVARLYDVQQGRVLVDGRDVREVTQHSLRSFMAIVPQETMLFAGTVRENITFARPEASVEQVRAAARAANALQFIEELPEGFETQVGEMGVRLSGGQQQRLAIARALLRDPRVLILDEATSSLDQESERTVHEALETLLEGRTALIIAHRLSTVRNADRILVLDAGRIVEQGRHEELMAYRGLYYRLYQSRQGEAQEAGGTQPAPSAADEG